MKEQRRLSAFSGAILPHSHSALDFGAIYDGQRVLAGEVFAAMSHDIYYIINHKRNHFDEGLGLETSVFESFPVANLPY